MNEQKGPRKHHWLNTIVGQIDAAFLLTQEELFATSKVVGELLDNIRIEDRGMPAVLPTPLVAELSTSYWAVQLHSTDRLGSHARNPRRVDDSDITVSLDVWRNSLSGLVLTAFPDMSPIERIIVAKTFDALLESLGVPNRAPRFIPDNAVMHFLDVEGN